METPVLNYIAEENPQTIGTLQFDSAVSREKLTSE